MLIKMVVILDKELKEEIEKEVKEEEEKKIEGIRSRGAGQGGGG